MLESTERSFHKKFTDLGISFPSFTCKSSFQPSANILLYAEAYPGAATKSLLGKCALSFNQGSILQKRYKKQLQVTFQIWPFHIFENVQWWKVKDTARDCWTTNEDVETQQIQIEIEFDSFANYTNLLLYAKAVPRTALYTIILYF